MEKTLDLLAADARKVIVAELRNPDGELRQLIARLARSEAKNFYATRLGLALEEFDRLLTERIARAVESLGSAAPSLDRHAADAVALTAPDNASPERCLGCGFMVLKSAAGLLCKSGEACPFHGKPIIYLTPPGGNL